ncbi:MAG: type III-A CRISPR-associated protein Csm2 [Thermodesulfobacteriota bacterium]|nr:type III-A CRISPR-associated protein Csm2 [Thermodesulfobacteriota bacterium]
MEYFDEAGIIRADLLDKDAYEQANRFVVRFNKKHNKNEVDTRKSLSYAQLRKFFNEFRQLEKKVNTEGFNKVKPLIKMVKSKASYAANPNNPKIPIQFKEFLIDNVNRINEEKDFEAFMLHFEAVVGFFYGIEGIKNN